MYAPNFHAKNAPKWDHYEFRESKRNAIGAGFQRFLGNFIPPKTSCRLENHPEQPFTWPHPGAQQAAVPGTETR